ncbi:hypothetical protein CKM354_000423200 [Cercospora kikuchii]|uniref:Uncharacterized protein n=1 Tax=Cercospora kikuchii TaxID=84275 RepID=A0A9P3CGF8_9PEZI|nr:uncharacterized protein CKM354_000423200 [Cercospora kikuchii]GIZ40912.1 hypothetical protein CKM354_000423200 [Cercospora kikuchii]
MMEHAAIFIPASPASSAAHTPIKFRTPAPSRSGSIWIPATPPSGGFEQQQPPTSYPMSDDSWAHLLLDDASIMVPHHLNDDNGLYDPTYDPTHQTTSEASTASTATPSMLTEPIESTSQYLVRISCEFIDSINNRDWANAERLACIVDHTCFTARLTEFPEVDSWWKHLETYKFIHAHAPNVYINILGTSCELDEFLGCANVYINAEASGQPGGIATQGVSLFEWKRNDFTGEWLCVRHTALKGIEGIV